MMSVYMSYILRCLNIVDAGWFSLVPHPHTLKVLLYRHVFYALTVKRGTSEKNTLYFNPQCIQNMY